VRLALRCLASRTVTAIGETSLSRYRGITMAKLTAALIAAVICVPGVFADEGMWTFTNVPRAAIAQKYGVQLSDDWLNRLQKSVVRLEG
jgi:hypothetical protein